MQNRFIIQINFIQYILFLVYLFLMITPNLYSGEYGDIYGAHPAANGMGNAVTATVNNSSSVFYNIAGLGRLSEGEKIFAGLEKEKAEKDQKTQESDEIQIPKDSLWKKIKEGSFSYRPASRTERTPHELTLQYHLGRPQLSTNAPQNQDITRVRDDFGGLGLTLNLNSIYDFKRNFKFGLNIMLPGSGNLLTINDVNPTAHRYLQHGVSNDKLSIMGGIGIELWKDRLFAGVGFNALISGKGAILMKDVPISPDKVVPNQQVILETKPFVNPVYGIAFEYGKFQAGVSYRREMALSVDGLPARAQTTLLGIQLDFDIAMFDHFSPRKTSFGVAYRPLEKILISAQLDRELWSAFRLSRTKKTYSDVTYFNDISVPRFGIEYQAFSWLKLRAGATKRPRPTPTMTGSNNYMDFDRMIGTAGVSIILNPGQGLPEQKSPIILDLVGEYQKLTEEFVTKANPTVRNPSYTMGGKVIHVGFSITMFF